MAQLTVTDLLRQGDRLGLTLVAGPDSGPPIVRVEVTDLGGVARLGGGTLAIVADDETPPPYLVDVALRHAAARGLAALIFPAGLAVTETATTLAAQGALSVLTAEGTRAPDLAIAIDRVLSGGAAESMTRASYAIEQATAAAEGAGTTAEILAAATVALGLELTVVTDATVSWTDGDAVFVGEVPVGRLVPATPDPAATVAVPVVASLVSRAMQRAMRDRFAPGQSRADLIVELVLAEGGRVDGLIAPAARLGLPLQLSHVVGWMQPRHRGDPAQHVPRVVGPAVELFALQLFEQLPELWHIAFIQDDILLVSSEEHGAGNHQRRLRETAQRVQAHAAELAGEEWTYTLGLGTPQVGATGLRHSAAEARVAAESAIAAGRLGAVELTDVTGLRRLLLDFYASPVSRSLLDDVLHPLDALGPERTETAVRTLQAYLAHRNSLARAGERLNLHPNAVAYRLKRIRELLDVDLDDVDVRFAVELACRVRLLAAGRR